MQIAAPLTGSIPTEIGLLSQLGTFVWFSISARGFCLTTTLPTPCVCVFSCFCKRATEILTIAATQFPQTTIPEEMWTLSSMRKCDHSQPPCFSLVSLSHTHAHTTFATGWLVLDTAGLSGPLSPMIGNLDQLEFLSARFNFQSGPLPTELGKLTRLRK